MQQTTMSSLSLMLSVFSLFLGSFTATADTAAEIDRDVDNSNSCLVHDEALGPEAIAVLGMP